MPSVVLGGTFDPLHKGHAKLIDTAVKLAKGGRIVIGVTSDKMARKRFRMVMPFKIRVENLKRYFLRNYGFIPEIEKIDDAFGNTLTEDYDYIVVSHETESTAKEINKKRREIGKKEIKIVVCEIVMAEDGKPISSTRIKEGKIDRYGRVIGGAKL